MNKIILLGHMGNDPELKTVGTSVVCKVSVATNERFTDSNNNVVTHTDWHPCVFWGKAAENLVKFAKKGSEILIEGKQKVRTYEDQNGKHTITENIVSNFTLTGLSKREGTSQPATQSASSNNTETDYSWSGQSQEAPF